MLSLAAVLIAAVSNLDNLSVGVALGMRGRPVTIAPNAVIAAITMAGTAGAMTSGRAIARLLSPGLASDLGAAIIIAIGAVTLITSLVSPQEPAVARTAGASLEAVRGGRQTLSWRETLALGIALSLNNIGSGVGAGIAGLSPLTTTLLAGVFSLLCVCGGSRLGRSLGRLLFADRARCLAGVALIGVGGAMLAGAI